MWNYTKCTAQDREEKLNQLAEAFHEERDCLRFLSEVQNCINSTQIAIVLLQDLDANIVIELDYVPVNNYEFHVIDIQENGIKKQGPLCTSIEQAVRQFRMYAAGEGDVACR